MTAEIARQLLPVDAYRSRDWFEREQREIFSRRWTFAGLEADLAAQGEFLTVQCGNCGLFIVRCKDGGLRAFHNLCRHRGTELLEGCGTIGRTIVCPYHNWSYSLDGALLGAPRQKESFAGLDKSKLGLHPASTATLKGMIFIHPEAEPDIPFDDWIATLPEVIWPHDPAALSEGPTLLYEMRCNWKVFYENAIDGYHLAYLHKKTLGGPSPSENIWEPHGRHMVWYSTETKGQRTSLPAAVAEAMAGASKIEGAESGAYGGVYMLYPSTIVTASPYDFTISSLTPVDPELSHLRVRTWGRRKSGLFAGSGPPERGRGSGVDVVSLDRLEGHPMESGDFMLEDLWICEKIQRSMKSPLFSVGALARGDGCETPLNWFQAQLLSDLEDVA